MFVIIAIKSVLVSSVTVTRDEKVTSKRDDLVWLKVPEGSVQSFGSIAP